MTLHGGLRIRLRREARAAEQSLPLKGPVFYGAVACSRRRKEDKLPGHGADGRVFPRKIGQPAVLSHLKDTQDRSWIPGIIVVSNQ
jgi:hypothetical protein